VTSSNFRSRSATGGLKSSMREVLERSSKALPMIAENFRGGACGIPVECGARRGGDVDAGRPWPCLHHFQLPGSVNQQHLSTCTFKYPESPQSLRLFTVRFQHIDVLIEARYRHNTQQNKQQTANMTLYYSLVRILLCHDIAAR
jgi:hypothetical protein